MLKREELLSTRSALVERKAQLTKSIDEQINAIDVLLNGGILPFEDDSIKADNTNDSSDIIVTPAGMLAKGVDTWDKLLITAFKAIPNKTGTLGYLAELCLPDNPKYNKEQIVKRFRKEASELVNKKLLKVVENSKRDGYIYEYIGE